MTKPRVPLLDLVAQYQSIRSEVDEAIARVVETQQFIMGPEVEALEEEVAAYCGAPHGVGCSSGSEALLLALMALGVGPGDDVVVPTYTFFSTAGSVARLGARPVFADIEPGTCNVTAATVENALARCDAPKAVIPVHLFGQAADLTGIGEVVGGLPLIEDAAQAIGCVDAEGHRVGSRGSLTCLSFFPSKNLGAYGDGGMILGHDPAQVEQLRILRLHGSKPKYHHAMIGLNGRLDALQASVLRAKLVHLDAWREGRAENAAAYESAFREAGAAGADIPLADGGLPLRVPVVAKAPARHVFNQFVIRVPAGSRDALRARLTEQGIGNEVYYPVPLHQQECFAGLGGGEGDLPVAERAAAETVALPIYPELTSSQRDHVAGTVLDFVERL
ncbi:MAG: DegT/DnrJ/EryC1/StrS family aminotransferase [Myxococcota bacterium]|nr:DegT/DnrJ/EryC1/StrS family aminotransferase [Myxococcota bacterium]